MLVALLKLDKKELSVHFPERNASQISEEEYQNYLTVDKHIFGANIQKWIGWNND